MKALENNVLVAANMILLVNEDTKTSKMYFRTIHTPDK
jgi:hypothetical protein